MFLAELMGRKFSKKSFSPELLLRHKFLADKVPDVRKLNIVGYYWYQLRVNEEERWYLKIVLTNI